MTKLFNTKQAGPLRPHTEPRGITYAWSKGAEMKLKYMLYCEMNPVDLGIEDAQGGWDMTAFRRHIQSCGPCGRFLELLPLEVFCDLEIRHRIAKGRTTAALYHEQTEIRSHSNHPNPEKKA